jgi:hypothetical protein
MSRDCTCFCPSPEAVGSADLVNGQRAEEDSSPVFCLSSRLKSSTVAITRRTSLRLSVGVEKYPTTRFFIKYLNEERQECIRIFQLGVESETSTGLTKIKVSLPTWQLTRSVGSNYIISICSDDIRKETFWGKRIKAQIRWRRISFLTSILSQNQVKFLFHSQLIISQFSLLTLS